MLYQFSIGDRRICSHLQLRPRSENHHNFCLQYRLCLDSRWLIPLTFDQQHNLMELFAQYSSLLDGTFGKVPNLKPILFSKPFWARACKFRTTFLPGKKLKNFAVGILESKVYSEWGALCLFRAKKNGGARFLSDLQQLNKCLIRKPAHLPLIDEVLRKIQGFTFATCLDLNRRYYDFELDEDSKKLCGIILPWGRYVYAWLPQGCMPSLEIFQGHMTKIFYDFEDVIMYIDNIIIFTFEHHVNRLAQILDRIQSQNLHIHV
jgi:hypothetical protein